MLIDQVPIAEATRPTNVPNMWIVPTTPDLAGAEIELIDLERREYRLRDALAKKPLSYDFILIDCPPSLTLLTLERDGGGGLRAGPAAMRVLCARRTLAADQDHRAGEAQI